MSQTLVAIPALNEAGTIGAVISEVRLVLPTAEILVVDDGSSDATVAVARSYGVKVIVLPFNVGVGGAMRTAFRYAQDRGHTALVQVDADGQHIAAHIPELLEGLSEASLVIGARFAGEPNGPASGSDSPEGPGLGAYRAPLARRAAMALLAAGLGRVCGVPLTDTTSGFRATDQRAIALFAEHYPAEYLGDTVESLVIAARSGLLIKEVPVRMRSRQGGRASHSSARAALHLGRAILALYVALARHPVPGSAPGIAYAPRTSTPSPVLPSEANTEPNTEPDASRVPA